MASRVVVADTAHLQTTRCPRWMRRTSLVSGFCSKPVSPWWERGGVAHAMAAARHLFDRVEAPWHTRARLLVTHAISFVPQCDHIIFLRDGRITEQGWLLPRADGSRQRWGDPDEVEGGVKASDGGRGGGGGPGSRAGGRQRRGSVASVKRASLVRVPERVVKEQDRGAQSLMTVEKSAEGRVAWSAYRAYISAAPVSGAAATVCLMVAATASNIGKHHPFAAQAWQQSHSVDRAQRRECGSRCGAQRRRTKATMSTCSATWACTA